ncbi:MAG: LuxR C-terminal-related transcriptional regulator [Pseudomonadota bacterium]
MKRRSRGRPPHADVLTPAEWRKVHAVQHGMTNVEIARRRGVSVNAVKFHVANALAKLSLRNRRELRAWFKAPAGSAQAKEKTMNAQLQLGAIGQIARSVGDIAASEKWYRDVLGLPHLWMAFFEDPDGRPLALMSQA